MLWRLSLLSALLAFSGVVASAEAKTLRMAYDADPTSLDPHEQLASATLQLSHLTFDPLLRFRQDLTLEPRLATRWEKIDERTTRFHLREGVKFHSGRTLSAADVVWTFNRLKQSPDFKALYEPFSEAKAVDDLTVDLITKGPYPLVLNLATYIFPMDREFYTGTDERGRPKDDISKHGASFASSNVSGTGPFIVTEREQGVKLEFKRFADYWDKASPGNVDRIVFTPIKEPATRVAALLAGDVDFIAPVPPTDFDRIKGDPCCELITMLSTRILTFELNQNRVAAFKDPRVRLAINYAINRQGIVDKILRGFGTPAGELSPPSYAGYDPALVPRFDLDKAKALMAEAGYADGFSVTMMAPNNRYIEDQRVGASRRRHARQDQHQGRSPDHAQGAILAALRRARRRHHDDRLAVRHAGLGEFLRVPGDDAGREDRLWPIQCRQLFKPRGRPADARDPDHDRPKGPRRGAEEDRAHPL